MKFGLGKKKTLLPLYGRPFSPHKGVSMGILDGPSPIVHKIVIFRNLKSMRKSVCSFYFQSKICFGVT